MARELLFVDTEVLASGWWCITIAIPHQNRIVQIWDDTEALDAFYNEHKGDVWVGYNIKGYDTYIIQGILAGFNPFDISQWIIRHGKNGWEFSKFLRYYPLIVFDTMTRNDPSLKTFEGFMGDDIRESSVDFLLERRPTEAEVEELLFYNRHDVLETMEVFRQRHITGDPNDFEPKLRLIEKFRKPIQWVNKTSAQLTTMILGAERREYDDEWDVQFPSTLRLDKYRSVEEWFRSPNVRYLDAKLMIDIAGVPTTFAWGGVHGALENVIIKDRLILDIDVASLYPSIMVKYNLISRSVPPDGVELFKEIIRTRLEAKAKGDKGLSNALKICINSMYGVSGDKTSNMYDPRNAHSVCLTGQLLLLDLIEHIENGVPSAKFININTDGIFLSIDDTQEEFDRLDDVVYEWEQRTGLSMEFDYYKSIWQSNVNNYMALSEDGKLHRKGAAYKSASFKDGRIPIIREAVIQYLVHGTPVEETIRSCNDLMQFQNIIRLTSTYAWVTTKVKRVGNRTIGDEEGRIDVKTMRVFASKDWEDGQLYKVKANGAAQKWDRTPPHIFIDNGDVKGKPVPDKLDRQFYIGLAKEALAEIHYESTLFDLTI